MPISARTCPKCGYARGTAETAPEWQCPACGIAYAKYAASLESLRQHTRTLVTPPRAGGSAPRAASDGSVWTLVLANLFTLGVALWQGWQPAELLPVYWGQSVVIGIANFYRILALERFSAAGFKVFGRAVELNEGGKVEAAFAFALGYGFFHFLYLMFLLWGPRSVSLSLWFWACTAVFALNHMWSYRYNRDLDRQGTPDIGTMVATPYLRIVPMHLAILMGALFYGGRNALIGFCLLKMAADVAMHLVEHARLRKVRGAGGSL